MIFDLLDKEQEKINKRLQALEERKNFAEGSNFRRVLNTIHELQDYEQEIINARKVLKIYAEQQRNNNRPAGFC